MTIAASHAALERRDVRTILSTGVALGLLTVAMVVVFALLSRALSGRLEVIVQMVLILLGGAMATFLPARAIRPRTIDAIGWSTLTGLIGAGVFTAVDTVLLRPLKLYHWTWDAIGGGSGWWYIPIWGMGSAFLAWLGAWTYANRGQRRDEVDAMSLGLQAAGIAAVLFLLLTATGITPFTAGAAALAFALAVILQVPVAAIMNRR